MTTKSIPASASCRSNGTGSKLDGLDTDLTLDLADFVSPRGLFADAFLGRQAQVGVNERQIEAVINRFRGRAKFVARQADEPLEHHEGRRDNAALNPRDRGLARSSAGRELRLCETVSEAGLLYECGGCHLDEYIIYDV